MRYGNRKLISLGYASRTLICGVLLGSVFSMVANPLQGASHESLPSTLLNESVVVDFGKHGGVGDPVFLKYGRSEGYVLGDYVLGDYTLLAQGTSGTNALNFREGDGSTSETPETSKIPGEAASETELESTSLEFNVIEPSTPGTNIEVDAEGITNVEIFEPSLDTPLDRYYSRTTEHIFWRTDALIFISIPFSFLWSTLLKEFFRNFSVIGGFFEGARAPVLSAVNFPYSRDNYPASTLDPLDIFTWANLGLWPVVVAANDIIERTSVPKKYERTKKRMRRNRFYRDLILQNFY